MENIYLDNAATTQPRPEVLQEINQVLSQTYGNPSSTHSFGRHAKSIIELSRKNIAKAIGAQAREIVFTSCATESINWILHQAVLSFGVKRIISCKMEHHATLHKLEDLKNSFGIQIDFVNVMSNGDIDLTHLADLLHQPIKTMVSLMHVNNEIGTILDIERIAKIAKQSQALFHTDIVQSVGKLPLNLNQWDIDFASASAHKFHGPKGIGFAYVKKELILNPMIFGGEQEKGWRAGTEATHQIAGMAKAIEISYANLELDKTYILELKNYAISEIRNAFPEVLIHGNDTIYTILNVLLPINPQKTGMILFALDMKGIAVSRGSACQSGSIKPSHVLAEFLSDEQLKFPSLRISFSHFNTKKDIDSLVKALKEI